MDRPGLRRLAVRFRRLHAVRVLLDTHAFLWWIEGMPELGRRAKAAVAFALLGVELRHVLRVATLPFHHRDPFDRLLATQALEERLAIEAATSSMFAAVSLTDALSDSVSALTDLMELAISVIAPVTSSADARMMRLTRSACACLSTLVRASCTTRYKVVSTDEGNRRD